jgi:hypothetical protein
MGEGDDISALEFKTTEYGRAKKVVGLWHSPVFLGLIAAALALFGNM